MGSRTGKDRTGQNTKTGKEQDKANRIEQGRTGHDRTEQDRTI
jgi:hypothetical protein